MCWSAEVSLQSFGIGMLAIIVGYSKGLSLPTTLFCLTIVFMQLIEYFVWSNYNNVDINYIASISAFFLLWLQPIASMLTLPSGLMIPFMILYTGISMTFAFVNGYPDRKNYRMFQGEDGHLVWNWIQKDKKTYASLLVYFFFLFYPLFISKQYILLGVAGTTLLLSLSNFWNSNTWGSMWCWIVNYIVVGVSVNQVLVAKP